MKYLLYSGCFLLALVTAALFFVSHATKIETANIPRETTEQLLIIPRSQQAAMPEQKPVVSNNNITATTATAKFPTETIWTNAANGTINLVTSELPTAFLSPEFRADLNRLPFPRAILDRQPQALPRAKLIYPAKAQQRRIEGSVILTYRIDSSGQLRDIKVEKATPPGYFEQNALEYAATWKFQPAFYQGEAVQVMGRSTIEYRLP